MIIVMPLVLLQVVSTWIFYDRHWETVTRRLAATVAGLYLSFHADLPTGPSIVVVATGMFLAALLFSPSKGLVWQIWRSAPLPAEESAV